MGKRRTAEDRLRATAYHEAGHAVALLFYGLTPDRLMVHESGAVGGCCDHPHMFGELKAVGMGFAQMDLHLLVCLCGPVAEQRFRGLKRVRFGLDGGIVDYLDVDKIIHQMHGLNFAAGTRCPLTRKTHNHYLNFMKARAELLIHYQWECVEAIAEALLERGSLTGEEANDIYNPINDRLWTSRLESGELNSVIRRMF